MNNVISFLTPGSMRYVYSDFCRLKKQYNELLQPLREAMPFLNNPPDSGWTQEGTKEQLGRVRPFYDTCHEIDSLLLKNFVFGTVKAITGIALAILFPQTIIGFAGLLYAFEGSAHMIFGLKGFLEPRWHITAELYKDRDQRLVFHYGKGASVAC